MIVLGANEYGKAEVRLVRVNRSGDGTHTLRDLSVSVALSGDLTATHLTGDNSAVLTTDAQKNTVFAFAAEHGVGAIEDFALLLAKHFVSSQQAISTARVRVEEYGWERIADTGHSFARSGREVRTTMVTAGGEQAWVVSGLRDLVVLNSADSEFWGFARDRYTTLAETTDRILATAVNAQWRYGEVVPWDPAYREARDLLLAAFAQTHSYSLQQTLFAMGKRVLEGLPPVAEVRLSLPNKHHFEVDMSPFGLASKGEVFYAADRPYGLIEGTVLRDDAPPAGKAWLPGMDFLQPQSLDEALTLKAGRPAAVPIAGGTDVMVEINFDARRPETLLDLNRVAELTAWSRDDGMVRIGAGVSYVRLITELGSLLPGLAMAARTVGSPQIRNRGTIGGNLGAASPAGDCHPVLLAAGAVVEATSVRGPRRIPAAEFFTGPKRNALEPDELITAVLLPAAPGPQQFAKIGTRNAMVIAVCAFALELRPPAPVSDIPISEYPKRVRVGTGIGSAGPTPLRARAAEEFLAGRLPWGSRAPLPDSLGREFGDLVAAAAQPIDDVRGTAGYRRHALSVLARRTLTWTWGAYLEGQACA